MSLYLLDTDTVRFASRGAGSVGATLLVHKPSQIWCSPRHNAEWLKYAE
jgi:hypothetical protein